MKQQQKMYKNVILSGGGTGGHITPALAIAAELKRRDAEVNLLFVGALGRMEMQQIPAKGYRIKGIWISGLQRKRSLKNMLFPVKLLVSLVQCYFIIRKFKPEAVIGTGGFASGPLVFIASKLKIPTVIQEQNAFAGITNKLLAKAVDRVCVAYEGMERYFPKEKIHLTGNPTLLEQHLQGFNNTNTAFESLTKDRPTLVVLGGSLGAKIINETIEKHLGTIKALDCRLLWQTGRLYHQQYAHYHKPEAGILVKPFINKMVEAYAMGDVFISRAGAMAVSELCLVGKAVILIPSPNVAENHQLKNAQVLAEQKAALLIEESDLAASFEEELSNLIKSKSVRDEMGVQIKNLGMQDASKKIVNILNDLLDESI